MRRTRRVRAGVALLILIAALVLPAAGAACPLCKDAKSDADYLGGSASLPSGFYYSILLMVSAPFAVVGTVAFRIVLARRRLKALRATPALEPPADALLPDPTGARP